jgi:DNA-binding GntR family transcriptional regulator
VKTIESDAKSLTEQAYDALRVAIVTGELAPGELHSVQSLASTMKISRTPVREALLRLVDHGMVKFERNRGARILQATLHDIEEMFSLRLLLEVPAAYRAAEKATSSDIQSMRDALDEMRKVASARVSTPKEHLEPDARFHKAIALASGNKRLANILETLFDLQIVRGVSTWGENRKIADIYRDNEKIHRKIVARDQLGAAQAMRDHIVITSQILIAQECGHPERARSVKLPYMDLLELSRRQVQRVRRTRRKVPLRT